MTRRIDVSKHADEDADSIFRWLRSYSEIGADRWWSQLRLALTTIARYPERSGLAAESALLNVPIREHFFHTRSGRRYRIIYRYDDECVQVLRIRTPGQDSLAAEDLPT